ncbi:hypothetical protein [Aeromonas genomosp. paramedia]|uniref:hypothetical protein n=1 Tax=Aeromonas genomosp. paramedia TaxID=3086176 RepID=UPI001FFCB8E8|nr:hypothetical protein [Aeromonas genomosp. paramedia]
MKITFQNRAHDATLKAVDTVAATNERPPIYPQKQENHRMNELVRDPKKHPAAGDVLTRFGSTRTVIKVMKNSRGTITHVLCSDTHKEITISSWRNWTKDDCTVVSQGMEGEQNDKT